MDRMSALDTTFWDLENESISLHIGAIAVFEGPVPGTDEMRRRYAAWIAGLPRARERMQRVPLGLGRPVWVPDSRFDLDYHLRRAALPPPGGEAELHELVGRLMSDRLDPTRPLWETWVVEGLAHDRWALIFKIHHSMVDGLSGMALLNGVLDRPEGAPRPRFRRPAFDGDADPLRLVVDAIGDRSLATSRSVRDVLATAVHPSAVINRAVVMYRGLPTYLRLLRPSCATSLSGHSDRPRRYRTLTVDLADAAAIRHALGGTINDVVLALATAGLRAVLTERGERPQQHAVRCLVPVSTRAPHEASETTNRVSAMVIELPVDFSDAMTAYAALRARVREMKHAHQSEAGELVVSIAEAIPAFALSVGVRAALRAPHRVITTVVTNVPGPRKPVYLLARRMVALYPYVPIADVLRIGVAISSYDQQLQFGVTCDRASIPDVDVMLAGMEQGLAELKKAAEELADERGTQ